MRNIEALPQVQSPEEETPNSGVVSERERKINEAREVERAVMEIRAERAKLSSRLRPYVLLAAKTIGFAGGIAAGGSAGYLTADRYLEDRKNHEAASRAEVEQLRAETTRLQAEIEARKASEVTLVKAAEGKMITVNLSGMDHAMTPEMMGRIINETYPSGWTKNVSSIVASPEREKLSKEYGIEGHAAATTEKMEQGGDIITYYADASKDAGDNLSDTLPHELAHSLDWDHPWPLDKEKGELVKAKITERLKTGNRYMSSYVEGINNQNKVIEQSWKRDEYWAVVHAVYFGTQEPLEFLPDEDFKMVEDVVNLVQPGFNRDAAWERRRQLLDAAARVRFGERLGDFMDKLKDEDMIYRNDLREKLEGAWLERHFPMPKEVQAAGRLALRDFLNRWAETVETRTVALDQLVIACSLHGLATEIGDGVYLGDVTKGATKLAGAVHSAVNLDEATVAMIRKEYEEISAKLPVVPGVRLQAGELEKLMELDTRWHNKSAIIDVMLFRPAAGDRPLAAELRAGMMSSK